MDTLPPSVNKLPKTPTFHNRKEVLNMRSLHSSAYGKNSLVFNLCTSVNNLVDVYENLYFEFWSNKSNVALPQCIQTALAHNHNFRRHFPAAIHVGQHKEMSLRGNCQVYCHLLEPNELCYTHKEELKLLAMLYISVEYVIKQFNLLNICCI